MEDANLQRPLVPVPLTLELIRATFQPLRNRDFVVPFKRMFSTQSFERIGGKRTQYTFEYRSVF